MMTSFTTAPIPQCGRILVFDVETTGLLPKQNKMRTTPFTELPYVIQLSFALYDIKQKRIISQYDSYIKNDPTIVIPEKIQELTGITPEICSNRGRPIIEVLYKFNRAYKECDVLVAHNMEFDLNMVQLEIRRNYDSIIKIMPAIITTFSKEYEERIGMVRFCTMKESVELCSIYVQPQDPTKKPWKKWPSLAQLYAKLFDGATVNGLHNSMVDVLVCLQSYLKMRYGFHDTKIIL